MEKYSSADFSKLKNLSIYYRSKGHQSNTSIYFINTYKGECSPYIVEVSDTDKNIVKTDNHLVVSTCGKDFLSKKQIEIALKKYLEYSLCLVQVDKDGNVYLNPDKQEQPIYLRTVPNSTQVNLKFFKHYKDNWYVRK